MVRGESQAITTPPSALGRQEQHPQRPSQPTTTPRQSSSKPYTPDSKGSSTTSTSKSSRRQVSTSPESLRTKRGEGGGLPSRSYNNSKFDSLPSKSSFSSPHHHSSHYSLPSKETTTPLTPSRNNVPHFDPSKDVPSSPRVQQEGFSSWNNEDSEVGDGKRRERVEWGTRAQNLFGEYYDDEADVQGDIGVYRGCIVPYVEPDEEMKDTVEETEALEKVLKGSSSDDEGHSSTPISRTSSTWNLQKSNPSPSSIKSQEPKYRTRASKVNLHAKFNSKNENDPNSHRRRRQPSQSLFASKSNVRNGGAGTSLPPHLMEPSNPLSSRPATPPTPSSPKKYGQGHDATPTQQPSSTPPPTPVFDMMKLPSDEDQIGPSDHLVVTSEARGSSKSSMENGRRRQGSSSLDLPNREPMGPPIVPRSQSVIGRSSLRVSHLRGGSTVEASAPVSNQRRTVGASLSKRMPNLNFSRLGQAIGIGNSGAAPSVLSSSSSKHHGGGTSLESGSLLVFPSVEDPMSTPKRSNDARDSNKLNETTTSPRNRLVTSNSNKSKRKSPIKSPSSPRIPKGARTRARPQAPANFSNPPSSASSSSSLKNGERSKHQVQDTVVATVSQPEAALLSKTSHNVQSGFPNGTLQSSGFKPTKAVSSITSSSNSKTSTSLLGPAFDDGASAVVKANSAQGKTDDGRVGLGMGFPQTQTHPLKSLGAFSGISSYFNNVGSSAISNGFLESSTGVGLTRTLMNGRRRANVSALLPSALPSPDQSEDESSKRDEEVVEENEIEVDGKEKEKDFVVVPMTKHSRASLSLALKEGKAVKPGKVKNKSTTTPKGVSAFHQTLLDLKNREVRGSPPTPALSTSNDSPSEVPSIIITPPPAAVLPSAARRLYATLNSGETSFSSFKSVLMDSPNTFKEKLVGHEGIGSALLALDSPLGIDSPISVRGPSGDAFASPASFGQSSVESSPSSLGSFDTPSLEQYEISGRKGQSEVAQIPLAVLEARIEADTKGFNSAAIQIDSLLSDFLRMGNKQAKINFTSKKLVSLLDDIFVGKATAPKIPTLFLKRVEPLLPYHSKINCLSDEVDSDQTNYVLPKAWLREEHENMLEKILDHVITGIFALLQDDRSPWEIPGMLSKLVVIMKETLSSPKGFEEDLETNGDSEAEDESGDKTQTQPSSKTLDASVLLVSLLQTHISGYLDRGEEARGRSSCLNVPPPRRGNKKRWAALAAAKAVQDAAREKVLKMAAKGIISEEEYRRRERKKAAQGDPKDTFAHVNIVRFVGELYAVGLLSLPDLQSWLHRLFFDTVHPDVPSAFELEAGCALLITVGLPLENRAEKDVAAAIRSQRSTSSSSYSERSLMDYTPATPPPLSSEGNGLGIQSDGSDVVMTATHLSRSDSAPMSHWIHHNHSPSNVKRSPLLTPRHVKWARTHSAPSSPRNQSPSSLKDGSDSIMKSLSSQSSGLSTTSDPSSPSGNSIDSLTNAPRGFTNPNQDVDAGSSSPSTLKTSSAPIHSEARHTLDSYTSRIFELLLHEDIIVDAKDWIKELLALRQRNWRHRSSIQ